MLSVGGAPYDTLEEVIGTRGAPGAGSLACWGVTSRIHPLCQDGLLDIKSLAAAIRPGATQTNHQHSKVQCHLGSAAAWAAFDGPEN
jgi:cystathionine beta-lyase family protein involved in aluminum resistance